MSAANRRPRRRATVAAALTLAGSLLAAACSGSSAQVANPGSAPSTTAAGGSGATAPAAGTATAFPGAEWAATDARAAGLDPAKLEELAQRAQAGGSNCFLVVRDGKLVGEWYWNGTGPDSAQEVFSATKSYTSALVGIAQGEGKLSISDKAATYIPQWKGTPSEDVTVRNLLANDSGRHWDAATDYLQMATREQNKTEFSIGLGQDAPPGTTWAYNNSAIQTLSAVLEASTGMEAAEYAEQKLLGPIGMDDSVMKKDPSGGTLTFMGLSSTCRDMARFGHLMLNKGSWDGKQILPAAYVEEATGRSSQSLNAAYGYLFWLNRKGRLGNPMQATTGETGGSQQEGQMVPGAPDDMYWALGLGNQVIAVDPGSKTVVVRLGPVNVPRDAKQFTQRDMAEVVTQGLVR